MAGSGVCLHTALHRTLAGMVLHDAVRFGLTRLVVVHHHVAMVLRMRSRGRLTARRTVAHRRLVHCLTCAGPDRHARRADQSRDNRDGKQTPHLGDHLYSEKALKSTNQCARAGRETMFINSPILLIFKAQ